MSIPIFIRDGETFEEARERTKLIEDKINYADWKPKQFDEDFIFVDGFVTVIIEDEKGISIAKKCIIDDIPENSEKLPRRSLESILNEFDLSMKKMSKYAIVYIQIDNYLKGDIYKCSVVDSDKCFYHWGSTMGFV